MRLPLGDLTDVVDREDDPATALMEGDLPAVRASPQRTLRQVFKPQLAKDLCRLCRREDTNQSERTYIKNSHDGIVAVMQITSFLGSGRAKLISRRGEPLMEDFPARQRGKPGDTVAAYHRTCTAPAARNLLRESNTLPCRRCRSERV